MQKNAYLLAKIGADTAENERNFAEILAGEAPLTTAGAEASPAASRWSAPPAAAGRDPAARLMLDPETEASSSGRPTER